MIIELNRAVTYSVPNILSDAWHPVQGPDRCTQAPEIIYSHFSVPLLFLLRIHLMNSAAWYVCFCFKVSTR